MQQKKPPFKALTIVFFAIAAVFLVLSVLIFVRYSPKIKALNTKDTKIEEASESSSSMNDLTSEQSFDDFQVGSQNATLQSTGDEAGADGSQDANADGTGDSTSDEGQ